MIFAERYACFMFCDMTVDAALRYGFWQEQWSGSNQLMLLPKL
jgi:hypothetical protein